MDECIKSNINEMVHGLFYIPYVFIYSCNLVLITSLYIGFRCVPYTKYGYGISTRVDGTNLWNDKFLSLIEVGRTRWG